MATSGKNSPGAIINVINSLVAGTTKDIVGKATVNVQGTAMTAAQLNAKLGTGHDLYGAVADARVTLKTALAAWEAALPALKTFITSYKGALKGMFGANSIQLLDFGINPAKKPAVRTAAQKAVSAALAKQTRTVRGTGGKKQKAATTTQGKPGLVLVTAGGTPIPGGIAGPTPPGSSAPVDAASSLVSNSTSGSTPSNGGTASAAPAASTTPAGK